MSRKKGKINRTQILTYLIVFVFSVAIIRLFILQTFERGEYQKLANSERMRQFEIPAKRGIIYAMDGDKPVKLVLNEVVYSVFADPEDINASNISAEKISKNKSEIIQTLKEIAGGNVVKDFESLLDKKGSRYQVLAVKLSRVQAEKIRERNLRGVGFVQGSQRVYPEGQLASQVLGFVNYEGGKYGVEGALNSELTGKNGQRKITINTRGNRALIPGKEDIEISAEDGKNIVLSIDRNIQSQAEKILAKNLSEKGIKNGSVLVMNPNNGKVLAMANMPTYDPAEYFSVKDARLFNNNTVVMPYENGSVIKSLTMAMGINEGVASADSTYYNIDRIQVGDRTINNAVKGFTGQITMQTAMNYSLNTGMVTIAQRLGGGSINKTARDKIYDYFYNRLGLGQETGIEVFENVGRVISPDESEGNAVRYSNMSFGQGMDTTMLQTATAFSSAINGGKLYQPSLINGEIDKKGNFLPNNPKIKRESVFLNETSQQIKDILIRARNSVGKSGDIEGFKVGGKTGTSQTLVGGKYVDNQTIGSYLGFGGNSEPKFVIMVAVWGEGQNLQGNKDAAPIFTEISNWMLNYLKVNPKG